MANNLLRLEADESTFQIECSIVGGQNAPVARWLKQNLGESVKHLRAALGVRGAISATLYLKRIKDPKLTPEEQKAIFGLYSVPFVKFTERSLDYGTAVPTGVSIYGCPVGEDATIFCFSPLPQRDTPPVPPATGVAAGV